MAPSRTFSIFLLKASYEATTALRDENNLTGPVGASNLPPRATLFIMDGKVTPPWWKSYFGVRQELLQSSKGAIVFLPVKNRTFALAFGHVSHNLKDESYEYDFGIRVTLNCVDPKKLKSTDTLDASSALRRRAQHAVETELTYFDFDNDSSILKSITGKVKTEHTDLVKNVTGASNLRVSTPIESRELVSLCSRLLALYADDAYLASFPDIQKITPVRDPEQIERLNQRLQDEFQIRSDSIQMTVPDLIDYTRDSERMYVSFSGGGRTSYLYPEASIEEYYEYLENCGIAAASMDIKRLKSHRMQLANENGDTRDSYSIFKTLLFDTVVTASNTTYYLNEGNWYEVDRDYVRKLIAGLDPYWSELDFMDDCSQHLEADYNMYVARRIGYVCLDQTSITPERQTQMEPCDLYTIQDDRAALIHVKKSTASSLLSHLFNQGTNSAELLKTEDEAPQRLIDRIQERCGEDEDLAALAAPINSGRFSVVYAIVTKKDSQRRSLNLPLFSRISLARNIKALHRVMNVPVRFGFVKDISIPEPKKEKPKKSKGSTASKKN
jgi:uncharacterized protein (TIGR04141 family)